MLHRHAGSFAGLDRYVETFPGLECLVDSVSPLSTFCQPPCVLVNNDDVTVSQHIVVIAVKIERRPERQLYVFVEVKERDGCECRGPLQVAHFSPPLRSQLGSFGPLVAGKVLLVNELFNMARRPTIDRSCGFLGAARQGTHNQPVSELRRSRCCRLRQGA